MIETSDISINSLGASLVAPHGRHPIGGLLEEAHCQDAAFAQVLAYRARGVLRGMYFFTLPPGLNLPGRTVARCFLNCCSRARAAAAYQQRRLSASRSSCFRFWRSASAARCSKSCGRCPSRDTCVHRAPSL
ncbi:hypothetical protein GTY77_33535 [Streptomyces sp. SID8380]|nr:hypothetical protein [Streptomyces sp. SID8380]